MFSYISRTNINRKKKVKKKDNLKFYHLVKTLKRPSASAGLTEISNPRNQIGNWRQTTKLTRCFKPTFVYVDIDPYKDGNVFLYPFTKRQIFLLEQNLKHEILQMINEL